MSTSQHRNPPFRFRPQTWTAEEQCLQLRNPWRRLWAKVLDFSLVGVITAGLLTLIGQSPALRPSIALPCLAFSTIAYDTLFLTHWGSTPGKRLWGLTVQTQHHRPLPWESALIRSVWVNGLLLLSALIPLMPFVLLVYQKQRLCRSGFTSWDAPQQTLVYRPDVSYPTP
jgi:uncharacterized RDD family membrane protein YckC